MAVALTARSALDLLLPSRCVSKLELVLDMCSHDIDGIPLHSLHHKCMGDTRAGPGEKGEHASQRWVARPARTGGSQIRQTYFIRHSTFLADLLIFALVADISILTLNLSLMINTVSFYQVGGFSACCRR